jgi:hypothetical protein
MGFKDTSEIVICGVPLIDFHRIQLLIIPASRYSLLFVYEKLLTSGAHHP